MNWLHYLVEANIYLSVFYLGYCLFLHKETHYMLNRIYLLFSCGVSFIIPMLQIGLLKVAETPTQTTVPEARGNMAYSSPVETAIPGGTSAFTLQDGILYVYLLGAAVLFMLLTVKLYQLLKLSQTKNAVINGDYKLVYLEESNTAFSFCNYLFIGINTQQAETIIRHELVHIHQKHTADIILLELFKIVNWFNPIIYLLQNSLKTVHEYIADEQTVTNETDALTYSSFLVNNAYGISGTPITHSFFNYNLLKKRIIMLHQQRSGSLARLKYLIAVPLCAALLCVSTLTFSKNYNFIDLAPGHAIKSKNQLTGTFTIKKTHPKLPPAPSVQPIPVKSPPPPPHTPGKAAPIIRFPSPVVVTDTASGAFSNFYSQLGKKIRYPKDAYENKITGKVFANFTVDADHRIQDISILREPSESIANEVIRVLKICDAIPGAKNGVNYTVSIKFILDGYSGPDTIDQPKKTFGKPLNSSNINMALDEVTIVAYLPQNK